MMFLLRTALWTSLVLALLPSLVPSKSPPVAVDIGAEDALTAASETIADLGGLCERRPEVCVAGAQFAAAFWLRTKAGAMIVYDFVGAQLAQVDRMHGSAGGSSTRARTVAGGGAVGTDAGSAAAGAAGAPDTLSATDLVPPWRGRWPKSAEASPREGTP